MSRKTKEEIVEEFRCASIQDAAMRVMARKGLDETTIQDIADEAGIAKGTLYVYFRDREELLARTADRAFENLVNDLEPALTADGTFPDRLKGVVMRQLQFFDENRALFQASIATPKSAMSKKKITASARFTARLEQFFADARERGEMRGEVDATVVAAIYRDVLRGVVIRRIETKSKTPREADAELIVSILLRGIESGEK